MANWSTKRLNCRAIFNLLGKGFTLLRFTDVDVAPIVDGAAERAMPLDVVDVRDARPTPLSTRPGPHPPGPACRLA
jgi:hypothetical protein